MPVMKRVGEIMENGTTSVRLAGLDVMENPEGPALCANPARLLAQPRRLCKGWRMTRSLACGQPTS